MQTGKPSGLDTSATPPEISKESILAQFAEQQMGWAPTWPPREPSLDCPVVWDFEGRVPSQGTADGYARHPRRIIPKSHAAALAFASCALQYSAQFDDLMRKAEAQHAVCNPKALKCQPKPSLCLAPIIFSILLAATSWYFRRRP